MSELSDPRHVSVLRDEVVEEVLVPFREGKIKEGTILDCTFGAGGHSKAVLDALELDGIKDVKVVALDQDLRAIEAGKEKYADLVSSGRLELIHSPLSKLDLENRQFVGVIADLGFSSDQLDDPSRGLSFRNDGPLDMRMSSDNPVTCESLLQSVDQDELEKILSEYGEERFASRIAGEIVRAREEEGLPQTTRELSLLVVKSIPRNARHGKIHASTRTFQALRIAVNRELEELDWLLERVIMKLEREGRVAIISFHSLEDRRVKNQFRSLAQDSEFEIITKKPIQPKWKEKEANTRARSAKMRIAARIGAKGIGHATSKEEK